MEGKLEIPKGIDEFDMMELNELCFFCLLFSKLFPNIRSFFSLSYHTIRMDGKIADAWRIRKL